MLQTWINTVLQDIFKEICLPSMNINAAAYSSNTKTIIQAPEYNDRFRKF